MPDRIAIKRLSMSDLSFFESHFRLRPDQRQKAINLNKNIFIGRLYPALDGTTDNRPIGVTIFGPGESGAQHVRRPITFPSLPGGGRGTRRNWRLNGGVVRDPVEEPGRYGRVQINDLAVMEFFGDPFPDSVTLVLVSAAEDPALHGELSSLPPGSMLEVDRAALARAVEAASTSSDHPIRVVTRSIAEVAAMVEEATFGSAPAVRRLRQRVGGRKLTPAQRRAVGVVIEEAGRDGEDLAWAHLKALKESGVYAKVRWIAATDAEAPQDFEAVSPNGETEMLDAKSTREAFGRMFHISGAQIATAADEAAPYRIIRVYGITAEGASVRISEPINALARRIADATEGNMPAGVLPDGFTIDPKAMEWSEEARIDRPKEGADGEE